jgi:hypothetical protein
VPASSFLFPIPISFLEDQEPLSDRKQDERVRVREREDQPRRAPDMRAAHENCTNCPWLGAVAQERNASRRKVSWLEADVCARAEPKLGHAGRAGAALTRCAAAVAETTQECEAAAAVAARGVTDGLRRVGKVRRPQRRYHRRVEHLDDGELSAVAPPSAGLLPNLLGFPAQAQVHDERYISDVVSAAEELRGDKDRAIGGRESRKGTLPPLASEATVVRKGLQPVLVGEVRRDVFGIGLLLDEDDGPALGVEEEGHDVGGHVRLGSTLDLIGSGDGSSGVPTSPRPARFGLTGTASDLEVSLLSSQLHRHHNHHQQRVRRRRRRRQWNHR